MITNKLAIKGAYLIELDVFDDQRGSFFESYQKERYTAAGIPHEFVQDNVSISCKNTMRGLHYQVKHPQGHLIQLLSGSIFDVGLDLRRGSETFGSHFSVTLNASDRQQLFLPPGIAHGFCALGENNVIHYKCTDYYDAQDECGVNLEDQDLSINWPIGFDCAIRTDKDLGYCQLKNLPESYLPSTRS